MATKKITNTQHYDACVKLYDKIGPSAVYEYANRHELSNWKYCQPCDTETPHLGEKKKYGGGFFCLVCGSHYNPKAKPEK